MAEMTISDAHQRRQALDIGRSFIVQAPAGSGKTELLTQRYLRLLATVEHPEEIYAITFTRKAAAEMRNRIIAALDAARTPAPEDAHRYATWKLAGAALSRDRALGWQLQDNPNRLRIQTFDSLSHALARQMPLLSELGAPPNTTERPEAHYRQAARATLRLLDEPTLGADVERLLTHLDNRQAQLEELLSAMLARRDQWLTHALSSPDGTALTTALENAVNDHLGRLRQSCTHDWLQQLAVLARQAGEHLSKTAKTTADPSSIPAWADRDLTPGETWVDLPAWQGLAQLLLTKNGGLRRSWDARVGFPAPSEKGIDTEEKTKRDAAKHAMKALAEKPAADRNAKALWAGVMLLPTKGPDRAQQNILISLLRVLLHAAAELQLVFQEHAEVDFAEIQIRAQRALGNPERPTDLALTLDYRLRHLLVDEFQDTSSSQYALLASLTAGWQAGDGRTLFAVGDPMQSIYRFREAEVGLYLAAREHGIGGLHLTPLRLDVNFRSRAAIVDWVNKHFPAMLPSEIDVGRGAVPYSPANAFDRSQDANAVQIHPFHIRDDEAEATKVVKLVRDALQASRDGGIAVLARARSHLHAIAAALKNAGLPFQAVEIDPLAQQPVVRDLYALTRALLHPADRLSWLVVLHAPWVGLALDDLLRLGESTGRTLLARLRDPRIPASLSTEGARRVERLLAVLDSELPARGRRPLRQWVEGIWLSLGGLATAGTNGEADAQAFFALLDEHDQAGDLIDFSRLDEALERLYALPDSRADGRLQLMTMHKAKGLEFDTVILPGLGRAARSSGSELLYWLERTGSDGHAHLLMAPIRAAEQESEPISNYLRELNKDKDRLEQARLLYVAVTRAKRTLHLLGHVNPGKGSRSPTPTAGSLLQQLWPAVESAFTDLGDKPAAIEPPLPTLSPRHRLPADWQPADLDTPPLATPETETASENRIEFLWAGDTARHVGTLVHRQLERIAEQGIEHWPIERVDELEAPLQRGLSNLGVDPQHLEGATEKALRALRNTLGDTTGRWILSHHRDARCEWPLTLHDDLTHHYVIDRSFIDDDGTRWIIDYKTGDHLDGDTATFLDQEQERYREQLETYGRIVNQLDPGPIRLALYFPLFADWRVWDHPG